MDTVLKAYLLPVLENGNRTYLQNERTPFSAIFPGSQKAFFSFFFTWAAESIKSIFESSSDELILPPVRPGTKVNIIISISQLRHGYKDNTPN